MPAAETTAAAGGALIKFFGAPLLGSMGAIALGFLVLWPRTLKEAVSRFFFTILFSTFVGPLFVIAVRSYWPHSFEAAGEIAFLYGVEPVYGFLFVAAPVMVAAGLPAWWIMGAAMRWFDNRRDKDLAQMASDAAGAVRDIRSGL